MSDHTAVMTCGSSYGNKETGKVWGIPICRYKLETDGQDENNPFIKDIFKHTLTND